MTSKAGCPFRCHWVPFPGTLRPKVLLVSLALCPWEDRAPFPLFRVVAGLGVLTPKGPVTFLYKSVQLPPLQATKPPWVFLHPSSPFPFQFNQANLFPFPRLLIRTQHRSIVCPAPKPHPFAAGLHLQVRDWFSYEAWRGIEAVSDGEPLGLQEMHVIFSCICPVGDGSSDLTGSPGKLLTLQPGRKASFNLHNQWVKEFPPPITPIRGPSFKNQTAGSLSSWLGSRSGGRDRETKYKQ